MEKWNLQRSTQPGPDPAFSPNHALSEYVKTDWRDFGQGSFKVWPAPGDPKGLQKVGRGGWGGGASPYPLKGLFGTPGPAKPQIGFWFSAGTPWPGLGPHVQLPSNPSSAKPPRVISLVTSWLLVRVDGLS
jgi:hypothetical protein